MPRTTRARCCTPHQQLLQDMAADLVQKREFDAKAVRSWLRDVPRKNGPEPVLDQ
ncbi:hypothetical protein [Tritonibacter scottomollicae]|uniref:hypothetical protein n=1 Tax=Tritonibacter scottomollicae TaxID=483013 RepID=UPI003AA9C552